MIYFEGVSITYWCAQIFFGELVFGFEMQFVSKWPVATQANWNSCLSGAKLEQAIIAEFLNDKEFHINLPPKCYTKQGGQ